MSRILDTFKMVLILSNNIFQFLLISERGNYFKVPMNILNVYQFLHETEKIYYLS